MKTINKGNGTGTGDSVKQALLKTADNFVETDSRLLDLERSMPRKLRGWAPAPEGFPQIPSAKGSRWTGAARVGSATIAASPVFGSGVLPLSSGKILVHSATSASACTLQLYAVSAAGALTALGAPMPIALGVVISAIAIGPDLICLLTANAGTGAGLVRTILSASETGLSQVALGAIAGTLNAHLGSYNTRGCRTANSVFMPAAVYHNGGGSQSSPIGSIQIDAAPAGFIAKTCSYTSRYGSQRIPLTHDVLGSDTLVALVEQTTLDGNAGIAAVLMSGTDKGVQSIDILPLASGYAGTSISAVALSATRVLLKGSAVQGVFALEVVDGELQLMSTDVQAAGILSRPWRAICQQDSTRALVFEQLADTALPSIIKVDPATGAITESGTVPLVFGTSGTASPQDAVKIGADRVVVVGRSASSSPATIVEVWDLT